MVPFWIMGWDDRVKSHTLILKHVAMAHEQSRGRGCSFCERQYFCAFAMKHGLGG